MPRKISLMLSSKRVKNNKHTKDEEEKRQASMIANILCSRGFQTTLASDSGGTALPQSPLNRSGTLGPTLRPLVGFRDNSKVEEPGKTLKGDNANLPEPPDLPRG